jgi:hypothetical protein
LPEAKCDHFFKVTEHLFGATNLMEVLQHGNHHLKVVRLLVFNRKLQRHVVHFVIGTQDEQGHSPDGLLIEIVLLPGMNVRFVHQPDDI